MAIRKTGVRAKKQVDSAKKVNPFELKFNRTKHKILGKQNSAVHSGTPGLTKKKAYENRLGTLAVEWKDRGKKNKIDDQRLCEGDRMMSDDIRVSKRFAAERLKHTKTDKFQLADEDDKLTHRGMALTAIEKYDRTMMSDDEDDGDDAYGNIDAQIVAKAHFGGGEADDKADRRRNALSELIAKTKQQRVDKQMARDEREDETARLDEKWKELIHAGTFATMTKPAKDEKPVRAQSAGADDYEQILFDLRNDSGKRVEASEKQKSEESARKAQERLLQQEEARLAKLNNSKNNMEYTSGSESVKRKAENGFEVKYDSSGALINAQKIKKASVKLEKIDGESLDESISDSDEEDISDEETLDKMLEDLPENSLAPPSMIESQLDDSSELPFVMEMPQKYEQLKQLFDGRNARECETIVERLNKLYHPSLREGNKTRLNRLFLLILRFYEQLAEDGATNIELITCLIRSLHSLLKYNVEFGARCMRALLRKQCRAHECDRRAMFTFEVIALLKLSLSLFTISDQFHPVITPNVAFVCRLIASVRVCTIGDAARILVLIQSIEQFANASKRYLPEVIAFLHGVFLLGVENLDSERSPISTFPISLPHRRMLLIENDCSNDQSLLLNIQRVFANCNDSFENNDANRLCTLNFAMKLLCSYGVIYSGDLNFMVVFAPFVKLLSRMPRNYYPNALRTQISEFETFVSAQSCKSSLKQLQKPRKEQQMLEMLEPRYEQNFDVERSRPGHNMAKRSQKLEMKELTRKYRREVRGTVRELRKDSQFLNREKRRETMENDRVRREKTKRLLSSLQGQESEYKKNESMKHLR